MVCCKKTFIKSLAFEYDIVFSIDLNSKHVPIDTTNLEWKFLWWAFHLQFKLCSSLFHAQCPHTSSRKYSRQSLKDFPKLFTYFSSVHFEKNLFGNLRQTYAAFSTQEFDFRNYFKWSKVSSLLTWFCIIIPSLSKSQWRSVFLKILLYPKTRIFYSNVWLW